MRLLPKVISPITLWGGVVTVIIISLLALGPRVFRILCQLT